MGWQDRDYRRKRPDDDDDDHFDGADAYDPEGDPDVDPDEDDPEAPAESDMDRDMDEPEFVRCPSCGRMIPEDAERCPKCGHYVLDEEVAAKKPWIWVVAVVLLVLLFSSIYALVRLVL